MLYMRNVNELIDTERVNVHIASVVEFQQHNVHQLQRRIPIRGGMRSAAATAAAAASDLWRTLGYV